MGRHSAWRLAMDVDAFKFTDELHQPSVLQMGPIRKTRCAYSYCVWLGYICICKVDNLGAVVRCEVLVLICTTNFGPVQNCSARIRAMLFRVLRCERPRVNLNYLELFAGIVFMIRSWRVYKWLLLLHLTKFRSRAYHSQVLTGFWTALGRPQMRRLLNCRRRRLPEAEYCRSCEEVHCAMDAGKSEEMRLLRPSTS